MTTPTRAQVLVVEDRDKWQQDLLSILGEEYDVHIAPNFESAIALLQNDIPYRVIIVDPVLEEQDLTKKDGFTLIQTLRNSGKKVPVVVLTAYPTYEDARIIYRTFDAHAYVTKYPQGKSFDIEEFREIVRDAAAVKMSSAFFMLPFTTDSLSIYEELKSRIEKRSNIRCRKANDFYLSTSIMDDVRQGIACADFVIADLSKRNANVFYEVGMSHALPKTVILLTQTMDDVPPDLKSIRHIVYENNELGVRVLADQLMHHIQEVEFLTKPVDLFGQKARSVTVETDLCVALIPQDLRGEDTYRNIIVPALERYDLNMRCKNAGSLFSSESVIKETAKTILKARVVVADMSGRDPNVFYEMGLSHGFGKEIVLMAKSVKDDVPFDLRDRSCIEYSDGNFMEQRQAQQKLLEVLKTALNEHP